MFNRNFDTKIGYHDHGTQASGSGLVRDLRGATVVEFAIVAPVFVSLLLAIFSVAIGGFQQLVLDDAVRGAARQLQIGGPASTSGPNFVTAVCNEFALVAGNCSSAISYYVQTNALPATFASLTPVSMPASGSLGTTFQTPSTSATNNVLIQVGYPLPFVVPFFTALMTGTTTTSIMSTTTVRTEPHS